MSEPQEGTESRATEQPPEGSGEPKREAASAGRKKTVID